MKLMIKIGTAAIFDSVKNKIKEDVLEILTRDVSKLIKENNEVIIVTSGAVGCGKEFVKGNNQELKQAQSSVGQIILMSKYSEIFSKYNLNIAQFLLSSKDLNEEEKIQNLKETYKHLKGIAIPIVNENDVTSIEELRVGDNDTLASKLFLNMGFDVLIILTEIGALIKNGKQLKKSNSFSVEDYDNINIPLKGFGGLKSKLDCAKEITNAGKKCIIAKAGDSIVDILSGKMKCTEFCK